MTPTESPATPPPSASRLAEILTDILSAPVLTNGEHLTATEYLKAGALVGASTAAEATLAAARYCFQLGRLSIEAAQRVVS